MKMIMKKKYLIFAAAALTLAACSNDDENLNGGPVELRLSSSLEVQTRAYQVQDEQLARGETVYVWADEQDGETDYIKAWELTAAGNGSFQEPATKQYFPQSGKGLSLYAIHGDFGASAFTENATPFPTTSLTHTVSDNQSIDANVAKSDLLYAVAPNVSRNGNPTVVPLTFRHLLAKVEVALKPGDGLSVEDIKDAVVTIENTRLKTDFTPDKTSATADDMISLTETDNEAKSITISTAVSSDATAWSEAIIAPQTLEANTQFIKVHLFDGGDLYYTLDESRTFASGNKYAYKITVNLTGLQVSSNIEPWGEDVIFSGDEDGQATM